MMCFSLVTHQDILEATSLYHCVLWCEILPDTSCCVYTIYFKVSLIIQCIDLLLFTTDQFSLFNVNIVSTDFYLLQEHVQYSTTTTASITTTTTALTVAATAIATTTAATTTTTTTTTTNYYYYSQ